MTTEHEYKKMCRDKVAQLCDMWGKEKFNEWWLDNVGCLRNVIFLDYKHLYEILDEATKPIDDLYDQIFRSQIVSDDDIRAKEWHEQHYDERPF